MNRINRFINELDGKGKVFSALFGVLTLFAVLGMVAPQWYEQMPEYSEWICGVTTWSAYNKQADMRIVQIAMLGIPVFVLFFAGLYVFWKRTMAGQAQSVGAVFLSAYMFVLCMHYKGNAGAVVWMVLWWVLFAGYLYLGKRRRTEQFVSIVTGALITMLSMTAGVLFLGGFSAGVGGLWGKMSWVVTAVGVLVFAVFILFGDRVGVLYELQFLLPLAWLGCFRFRYRYEKDGSLLTLFNSGRWKWMCVLLCVIFLAFCVLERKKSGRKLFFSSFIMTAVIRVFSQPEGLLNIDYFHNGEITMPMHQLVSYGKLPYVDIIPIHGMCDYYYGFINYLFFDGTYLSLNAAKIVGDLLAAVLLAVVLYFFTEHRNQSFFITYLFMPFLVVSAGMRYWFLFLMFFILFSSQIKKGMQSLYLWIWLSIFAIAWNASIGGAAALGFLPMILYRLWRDFPAQWRELRYCTDKKKRNLIWLAWGVLVAAGVAFLPLFMRIVEYLLENTGTTLYVNGMEMLSEVAKASEYLVPGIVTGQGGFFIDTFAFLFSVLVAFVMVLRKERHGAGEMFITYLVTFWVLANYSFVRYDEGLRSRVLGIFFLLLTASTLGIRMWREEKQGKQTLAGVLYAVLLGGAIMISGTEPLVSGDNLVLEKTVPESLETTIMGQEVDDPVVHVSGELVSMPGLGTGFIQGNTLVSLQNVNTLVQAAQAKGQTVFDITNAVANTVTLDMPLYLPYSSAYNISNSVMQEKAIRRLEQKLPDIILAAPEIRFDDAPFSFRSIHLYQYLMEQDYVPYKYENVIYLVHGENPLPQAQQNTEAFAQLMHKKNLSYLPAVWGANAENMSEQLAEIMIEYHLESTERGFRIVFDEPVGGDTIAMIDISGLEIKRALEPVAGTEAEQEPSVLMEIPSSIAAEGEAQFRFVCRGSNQLIPVCCSPYFTMEEGIEYLEFSSESMDMVLEDVCFKFYSW